MLKFLPKLHRIYYKSRFEIEGKNIKEINAELDMVFEFVEYVLGKGGITCMQTKCIGGQTLLHHAVLEGKADLCNLGKESADLCNLLIQSGAELDATNVYGETPLGTAIRTSNLDLVKLLLKHGANPNCGESFGSAPPLHMAIIIMAAKEGSADVCNLLIKSGAEIDATDVDGEYTFRYSYKN